MDLLAAANLNADRGFGAALGLVFDEVTKDRLTGHLDVGQDHLQPFGLLNGGVHCALVETFGSTGGVVNVMQDGKIVVGVSNQTDFLRPVRAGDRLDVVAEPIQRGRQQHLWQVTITRSDGKVAARGQVRLQVMDMPEDVTRMQEGGPDDARR